MHHESDYQTIAREIVSLRAAVRRARNGSPRTLLNLQRQLDHAERRLRALLEQREREE